MAKKKQVSDMMNDPRVDESALFRRVSAIIENRKSRAGAYVNSEATLMYWEVGRHIGAVLLGGERAEYGKQILTTLSSKLVAKYGKTFSERNLYRMVLFADRFPDEKILPPLAAKLSWSHIYRITAPQNRRGADVLRQRQHGAKLQRERTPPPNLPQSLRTPQNARRREGGQAD